MIIRIKNVNYQYPFTTRPALANINLSIPRGEAVGLIGASGSGKSSFCYLLNGTIPLAFGGKYTGAVEIDGVSSTQGRLGSLAQSVGLLFQEPSSQISSFNVEAELAFGLENLNYPPEEIKEKIVDITKKLEIEHLLHRPMAQLSEGEKQIVLLGAILTMNPKILVLDEPHSMVDANTRYKLRFILQYLKESGITLIIAEHNFELLLGLVDRILAFSKGEIVADGSPKEIFTDFNLLKSLYLPPPKYIQILRDIKRLPDSTQKDKLVQKTEEWLLEWLSS